MNGKPTELQLTLSEEEVEMLEEVLDEILAQISIEEQPIPADEKILTDGQRRDAQRLQGLLIDFLNHEWGPGPTTD